MTTTKNVDHDEFKRLHAAGMNRKDMAAHFGISVDAASRLREKLKLTPWANSHPNIPVEEFKAAYDKCTSVAELAAVTGYKQCTVRSRIAALGLPLYQNNFHDPLFSDDEFRRICAESKSTREVVQKTGYNRSTVNQKMKEAGIPPYVVAGRKYDYDYIIELLGKGMLYSEIARRVGCSERVVDRIVAKHPELSRGPVNPPLTDAELARAKEMLEDGASYTEVSRTLGRNGRNLQRRLPGYSWTPEQVLEHARLIRQMNSLFRDSTHGAPYAYNGVTPTRESKTRGEHNA